MIGLNGIAEAHDWSRDEDVADFFSPEVVFGHEGEPPKRAQPPGRSNQLPRFLINFAMQGLHGAFARIDTAAGQLKLARRRILQGQQKRCTSRQDRIGAGSDCILASGVGLLTKSPDHVPPFQFLLAALYTRDMPITGAKGNPNDTRFATRVGRYCPAIPT